MASPSTGDQCSFLSVSTAQDQGNFQSALYGVMENTVNFSTPAPPTTAAFLTRISDIVLQHKEQVLFQNPRTGNWQMSKELRNILPLT